MKWFIFLFLVPFTIFAEQAVNLTAEGALEWNPITQTVKAIKKAKVIYRGTQIEADLITGYYTESKGEKNFYRLIAQGDVRIQNQAQKLETQQLTYDLKKEKMTLEGAPWTRLYHEKAVMSSKEKIIYDQKSQTATATHAKIKHETRILTAPKLTAYFDQGGKGLVKVIASGNISLETEEETLTSKAAVYDAQTGLATLTDQVALTRQDGTQIKGGKLIYDMKKGVTRLKANPKTGKVEGIFQ